MTIDRNDPRLTAYALGELPDDERAEAEQALADDPTLKEEVASIREVADSLTKQLAEEPLPVGRAGAPRSESVPNVASRWGTAPPYKWLAYLAPIAAIVVIGAFLVNAMTGGRMLARITPSDEPATESPWLSSSGAQPCEPLPEEALDFSGCETDDARSNEGFTSEVICDAMVSAPVESGTTQISPLPSSLDGSVLSGRTDKQQTQLRESVDRYNQLLKEQRYAEAVVEAQRAHEIAPDHPVSEQMVRQGQVIYRYERNMRLQNSNEDGLLSAMDAVEWSARPQEGGSPLHYYAKDQDGESLRMMVEPRVIAQEEEPLRREWQSNIPELHATRKDRDRTLLESLESADESGAPFDESIPVHYPDKEIWAELSKRRQGEATASPDTQAKNSLPPLPNLPNGHYLADTMGYPIPGTTGSLGIPLVPHVTGGEPVAMIPRPPIPDPLRLPKPSNESYAPIAENDFLSPVEANFSTFSIDVDTASYSNVRRMIQQQRRLPPPDAVRIEEMINYFDYQYAEPDDETPFAAAVEVGPCPWAPKHQLAKIGLKGKEMTRKERPPLNLVFLLDVSGSMSASNKLPLVKQGMTLLTENLTKRDHVSIVVYASASGTVLEPTKGSDKRTILDALGRLKAGGSTAGGAGIQAAYKLAEENFDPEAVNRVILCTDGDFNVGVTNNDDLVTMIEEKAKSGVFLTVLGFGMGNLKDDRLEQLADKGNGNYGYIDNQAEAHKMLSEELAGTLVTIAKDVKIQIDFNPANVQAYRLIGYVNRKLRDEDFHDDTKDAGEIGAGHTVTALYEIVPHGVDMPKTVPPPVDISRYAPVEETVVPDVDAKLADELFLLKLRYKLPDEDTSSLLEYPVLQPKETPVMSKDFEFASSVALFGMLLRGSQYSGDGNLATVLELARSGKGEDPHGYRAEFIKLAEQVKQ